ncbi:hypothetical protein [Simiduia agarivorans]|uniref:Uncharacterized protein n=1 Tax=Simiduia agarivorans (strain DSM 21679 / JCM 13881 / BCRC 17597 / SA1) TaxID=1117647 RepID=K4KFB6_SIMAS|nr:hypothetical protein [Simiduia agarivorans]AFU97754.1 hypothetical protein M5M_02685 [Simiduia agarivorans SA1 = DSM 21679]
MIFEVLSCREYATETELLSLAKCRDYLPFSFCYSYIFVPWNVFQLGTVKEVQLVSDEMRELKNTIEKHFCTMTVCDVDRMDNLIVDHLKKFEISEVFHPCLGGENLRSNAIGFGLHPFPLSPDCSSDYERRAQLLKIWRSINSCLNEEISVPQDVVLPGNRAIWSLYSEALSNATNDIQCSLYRKQISMLYGVDVLVTDILSVALRVSGEFARRTARLRFIANKVNLQRGRIPEDLKRFFLAECILAYCQIELPFDSLLREIYSVRQALQKIFPEMPQHIRLLLQDCVSQGLIKA